MGVSTLDPTAFAAVATTVRDAGSVVAVGAGTHAGIGGAVDPGAVAVRAEAGIVDCQPADMTVTVLAGTTCAALDTALAAHGQECPLDPADPRATVGGVLATGLSGLRRLGAGPVRDTVLEVVLVLADGRVVRGGGPTVKNVTGYDIPRLVVGSLGTLGVVVRATLRTVPRPPASAWFAAPGRAASAVRAALYAPAAVTASRAGTAVWLEGHPDDLAAETGRLGLAVAAAPSRPTGPHRGRIAVAPGRLDDVVAALPATVDWLAEHGVGTVHVATDDVDSLAAARAVAHAHGGWMLREAGAPDLHPFGVGLPAAALQQRVRAAFDPEGKLAPGRIPA
ncbi:MAG: FAD-binding oxidoreductase [Acidimicrobiia bacterium]